MSKNLNIETHNKKYHIGAVIQGVKIVDILKYSKNGKSTLFLWECKCGNLFEAGSSFKIKKLCPECLNSINQKKEYVVCKRHVGIYTLRFKDFYYIGESINLESRERQHQNDLENNNHCNKQLQDMYNKGIRFQFEIIESIEFVKGHNLYFKLFNLIQERKYIYQYAKEGFKILNSEDSIKRLKEIPELYKLYEKFIELNVKSYDDILKLPAENNRRWNKFKSLFYKFD